jgi:hypothetical protein
MAEDFNGATIMQNNAPTFGTAPTPATQPVVPVSNETQKYAQVPEHRADQSFKAIVANQFSADSERTTQFGQPDDVEVRLRQLEMEEMSRLEAEEARLHGETPYPHNPQAQVNATAYAENLAEKTRLDAIEAFEKGKIINIANDTQRMLVLRQRFAAQPDPRNLGLAA